MKSALVAILAEIAASQARVAGMQACNASWTAQGQSPAYSEDHFISEAQHCDHLAKRAEAVPE